MTRVVGPGSVLQASVFVGRGARIGEGCYLMPGVVLGAGCSLANRVRAPSRAWSSARTVSATSS